MEISEETHRVVNKCIDVLIPKTWFGAAIFVLRARLTKEDLIILANFINDLRELLKQRINNG